MKIAICIDEMVLGGVSQSSATLALEFAKLGHETDILITGNSGSGCAEEIRSRGCSVFILCAGKPGLAGRLKIVAAAIQKYDVLINTHSLELQLLAPEISPEKILINTVRNAVTGRKILLNDRFFDAHVAISPSVAEKLMMLKASVPVHVIPNAVEFSSDMLPELKSPLRIAYLGRLERGKNVKILPEVFKWLSTRADCRLTVIGDGPEDGCLQQAFAEEIAGGRVVFTGACVRELVPAVLRDVHFLLVPSFYEGFGLVVAEAMACGVIPVTSNLPSFSWILGPDAELLQVEDNDSAIQYAERILSLAGDPDKYRELQRRLRSRQRSRFVPEKTAAKYLDLFKQYAALRPNGNRPVGRNKVMPFEYHLRKSPAFYFVRLAQYFLNKAL